MPTEQPSSTQENTIALLQEQNNLLRQLLELQKKEARQAALGHVLHTLLTLIPFAVILVLGFMIWQSIQHYLDALNNNINILKSNFDAIFGFFQKVIPDFSKITPELQQTWENIQFWK